MITKMAGQMSPEMTQNEAIKEQITQLINSGMVKFAATNNASYTFTDDGWVKSLNSDYSFQIMGQKFDTKAKVTLKQ